MPLTPEDVQNKRFTTTRFRPGYDEDEVDSFLDQVESELTRLLQENAGLRTRVTAGPVPAPAAPPVAEAAPPAEPAEGGQDAALRTLLLAQRTADEAIGQARKEAEQIVSDARTRASALEQEAQQRQAAAMAEMERRRRDLERQVEDLRAFEREYRIRLKAYLETQLRELSGRGLATETEQQTATTGQPTKVGPPRTPGPPPTTGGAPVSRPQGPPAPAPATAPPAAGGQASPFGPAPTFGRPGDAPSGGRPAPSGPPREADTPDAKEPNAQRGADVDQGPEATPSSE